MQSGTINRTRLVELREAQELTVDQLAALISSELGRRVVPATIYKIQQGRRQPSAQLFGAICRSLRCSKDELFMVNAPKEERTCPACGSAQDVSRQTCTICLIPDPPRPTGSEGMGR